MESEENFVELVVEAEEVYVEKVHVEECESSVEDCCEETQEIEIIQELSPSKPDDTSIPEVQASRLSFSSEEEPQCLSIR